MQEMAYVLHKKQLRGLPLVKYIVLGGRGVLLGVMSSSGEVYVYSFGREGCIVNVFLWW